MPVHLAIALSRMRRHGRAVFETASRVMFHVGQGVIAIASAPLPTLIGFPGVLVAVAIGVTVPDLLLATYTVFPSGVIAIAQSPLPILIGLPGVLVAVVIGVTVFGPRLMT